MERILNEIVVLMGGGKLKYYALIGFERYTHKVEISEETFLKEKSRTGHYDHYPDGLSTLNGYIKLKTNSINFIEYFTKV